MHSIWKQLPLSTGVAPAISSERPVRVTRIDHSEIVLEHPRIVGDSLIGDVGNPPERMALLLRDVQRVDERSESVNKVRTGANVVVGVAVYFLVMSVALLSGWR